MGSGMHAMRDHGEKCAGDWAVLSKSRLQELGWAAFDRQGNHRMSLKDRDYSEEFSITLEWADWNRVLQLVEAGLDWKSDPSLGIDWSETDEIEEDKAIIERLKSAYYEKNPGNGMDDWPVSMKQAYNETVSEMIAEELSQNDE